MADAVIDVVGVDELPLIVEMYNQIFRPTRAIESFRRRYTGRYNVLQMVARVKEKPAGFFLGFELKPDTFFAWFYGVMPEFRRMGIGSQLMEAAQGWAAQHEYESIRLECHNTHRPMLPGETPRRGRRRRPLSYRHPKRKSKRTRVVLPTRRNRTPILSPSEVSRRKTPVRSCFAT